MDENQLLALKQSRHLRHRYWSALEELRLIELWRIHFKEITTYERNEPIFRTIADGMKERRFMLNPQECRRKISSLRNKYLAERRRLQTMGSEASTDWIMWPYIHCIFKPLNPKADLQHEKSTLERLHNLHSNLPRFNINDAHKRYKYQRSADEFPFAESRKVDQQTTANIIKIESTKIEEPEAQTAAAADDVLLTATAASTPAQRLPLQSLASNTQSQMQSTTSLSGIRRSRRFGVRGLPKRGHITIERIERLRAQNNRLTQETEAKRKLLQIKEAEVAQWEKYFKQFEQHHNMLTKIVQQRATND